MNNTIKVIKIGGNIINDNTALENFLKDFSVIHGHKILVHGGGAVANSIMENMGIKPKMINGRRVTDKKTMEVISMVYAGLINKNIVSLLQKYDVNAIGLSGADANVITAEKRIVTDVDYGLAGDITVVNSEIIKAFINLGFVPVFNSVVHDRKGQLLNTNADTIAAEVASAMASYYKVELIYVFEKPGVLYDLEKETVIPEIGKEYFEELKNNGIINSGMLPKLNNCFQALDKGVKSVRITGKDNFNTNAGTKIIN